MSLNRDMHKTAAGESGLPGVLRRPVGGAVCFGEE